MSCKKNGSGVSRRKTPVLYVLAVIFLTILFFSNDFGLVDIQKTAIVLAVGIDRENDEFIVNSRIAVPSASGDQKAAADSIQVETRGDTVGAAIQDINTKTGWYPKLVFLNLIVLGDTATQKNAFDTLDFFLRYEYMSDDCQVCCCEGKASELLNTETDVEKTPSLAIGKILSEHSATTGLVAVASLRKFSAGYFGVSKSGYMPLLKYVSLSTGKKTDGADSAENTGESGGAGGAGGAENSGSSGSSGGAGGSENSGSSGGAGGAGESENSGSSGGAGGAGGGENAGKTFTATETALFADGVYKGKLTKDETFAFLCVGGGVRLAAFDVDYGGVTYTLTIKKSKAKIKFYVDDFAAPHLNVQLDIVAGLQDMSSSQTIVEIAAPEKTKQAVLEEAGKKLKRLVNSTFQKSRAYECDLFGAEKRLQKFERNYFNAYRENLLDRVLFYADVRFSPAR